MNKHVIRLHFELTGPLVEGHVTRTECFLITYNIHTYIYVIAELGLRQLLKVATMRQQHIKNVLGKLNYEHCFPFEVEMEFLNCI